VSLSPAFTDYCFFGPPFSSPEFPSTLLWGTNLTVLFLVLHIFSVYPLHKPLRLKKFKLYNTVLLLSVWCWSRRDGIHLARPSEYKLHRVGFQVELGVTRFSRLHL